MRLMALVFVSWVIVLNLSAMVWAGGDEKGRQDGQRAGQEGQGRHPDEHPDGFLASFNVFCRFPEKKDSRPTCTAAARFKKLVDHDGREILDYSESSNNPRFQVECDGVALYNDGSRRFTDYKGTRIQAESGPYPAILLPEESLAYGRRRVSSRLELLDRTLEGDCYIYIGNP